MTDDVHDLLPDVCNDYIFVAGSVFNGVTVGIILSTHFRPRLCVDTCVVLVL